MVARARGCSQEWSFNGGRASCAASQSSVIVVLFLMLAVVHCPLALQLAAAFKKAKEAKSADI